ncbi:MAG: DEAD/DEAH box helicase family protein, partial [Ktedonobacteraceae bacterium]|nr:DEAD/DEAH box helicase family protein [Ktedonobacteraceae bacterium]
RMPLLERTGLRNCQFDAITALEQSLAEQKQRALIQMATGSGKTYMTVHSVYRLIKFGGAKRVLFLVDRAHLGRQAYSEFRQYRPLDDTRTFPELYDVQHVQDNTLRPGAKVCIMTIQRLYSMLSGRPIDRQREEESLFAQHDESTQKPEELPPLPYKADFPIETFDFIVTDECHRSIYTLWRPVLYYFDAFITGLTATPGLRTLAFFNRNLIAEYSYAQAVADGVNVDYRVFRINTRISTEGGVIPAGVTPVRDSLTRVIRSKRLDKDYSYEAAQLNRDVVSPDQIRKVLTAYRDNWQKMFPDRVQLPKTLIFAQSDTHAEDIVEAARDVFAQGDEFVRKITYKVSGVKPEDLIGNFRNDYVPRIAVTVDMISTGTDIKPLEVLLFMRPVKSLIFFEQMKGRGSRTLSSAELRTVTPDGNSKTYFVLVDAVGVTEYLQVDNPPLDRKPSQSFSDVLKEVEEGNARNNWDDDLVMTLAGRLGRMVRRVKPTDEDWMRIQDAANGKDIRMLAEQLVRAVNKDEQVRVARENTRPVVPDDVAIQEARNQLVQEAMQPFTLPDLLTVLLETYRRDQLIDENSIDEITEQDWSPETKARAEQMVNDFYSYMQNNSAKINAFEILLNQGRASYNEVKQLARDIQTAIGLTESRIWQAYEQLDATRGRRASNEDVLADLVTLMRYTLERQSNPGAVLETFEDRVNRNFARWLAEQERQRSQPFTPDQLWWLTQIRDHIGTSLNITEKDFDLTPFNQRGSLKGAYDAFNNNLPAILKELNERLVA